MNREPRPERPRRRTRIAYRFGGAALALALLTSCNAEQTTEPGTIGVDRKQRMSWFVSAESLREGASAAYTKILYEADQSGALNRDPQQVERVRNIAARIIAEADVFRTDTSDWNWSVNVVESDQLNAWAMPGGKIAFYTGIIESLALTDDEIAAIMGHEIAHSLREHARERASEQATANLALQAGLIAGSILTGTDLSALSESAQLVYQLTFALPNSREHESEADQIGVELAARAGYDPAAAIEVWRKMRRLAGDRGGPEFLSTHPSHGTRIEDLTRHVQTVMPLYREVAP